MTDASGREYTGQARRSDGRTTGIRFAGPILSSHETLKSVRVIGRPEPTNAEKAREEMLLLVLQRQKFLRNSLFIRLLWFPSRRGQDATHNGNTDRTAAAVHIPLNDSQLEAVQVMTSEAPLVIIHGGSMCYCQTLFILN